MQTSEQGPSLSIDTACSSSLVAAHVAAGALAARAAPCSAALAAGINVPMNWCASLQPRLML